MVLEAFLSGQKPSHYMAILKRAVIVVNTKKWVYFRLPGQQEVRVPRGKLSPIDYLSSESKHIVRDYKDGDKSYHQSADFAEDLVWEQKWMEHTLSKAKDTTSAPPHCLGRLLGRRCSPCSASPQCPWSRRLQGLQEHLLLRTGQVQHLLLRLELLH